MEEEIVKNDEVQNDIDNKPKKSKFEKVLREIVEWVICFIIAYILYLVLNYFFGTISGVKQVSMLPTAIEGERLLIQRPTIFKKELQRGDIVTFEAPTNYNESGKIELSDKVTAEYEEYKGINSFIYNFIGIGKISYIKRVIGIEGDHIVISEDGSLYLNDEKITEPYLKDGVTSQNGPYTDIIVPEDCIFAMGDNRLESKDSRVFGCIPVSKVNGYVITRLWPFNKLGKL